MVKLFAHVVNIKTNDMFKPNPRPVILNKNSHSYRLYPLMTRDNKAHDLPYWAVVDASNRTLKVLDTFPKVTEDVNIVDSIGSPEEFNFDHIPIFIKYILGMTNE